MPTIRTLDANGTRRHVPDLALVLIDCVTGGASVSFQYPLAHETAEAFWTSVAESVATGTTRLLVAEHEGRIVGTVQVELIMRENQPHRAEIAKMLVHREARRLGLGAKLMLAAEAEAKRAGRTLLVLDTMTGSDAERMYTRLGWIRVGTVPGFALMPFGGFCDTTFFYKQLG